MVTLFSLREVEIEIISILAENLHCNHEEVVMMMTPVRNITSHHVIEPQRVNFIFFSSSVLGNFPGNCLSLSLIYQESQVVSGLWEPDVLHMMTIKLFH